MQPCDWSDAMVNGPCWLHHHDEDEYTWYRLGFAENNMTIVMFFILTGLVKSDVMPSSVRHANQVNEK